MKQPITIINKAVTTNIKHKFNPSRREYLFTTKIAKNPARITKKILIKPTDQPIRAIIITLNNKKISTNKIISPSLLLRLQL